MAHLIWAVWAIKPKIKSQKSKIPLAEKREGFFFPSPGIAGFFLISFDNKPPRMKPISLLLILMTAGIFCFAQKQLTNPAPQIKNGIKITGSNGIKIKTAALYFDDRSEVPSNNTVNLNQRITVFIEIQKRGWKETEGKAKIGASQKVTANTGDVILNEKDLFASLEDGVSPDDAVYISLRTIITATKPQIEYFTVSFRVWDKSGTGEINGSYRFKIKKTEAGWLNFFDNTVPFIATYPQTWTNKIKEDKRVFFTSPLDDSTDKFRENINLLVKESDNTIPMSTLFPAIITELKKSTGNFSLKEQREFKWNNTNAGEIKFTGQMQNENIRITQWYTFYSGKFYMLTYTAAAGDARHDAEAQKIMNSILFK